MQKGIGLTVFRIVHFGQGHLGIGKIGVVLGMLCDPLTCYDFYSF